MVDDLVVQSIYDRFVAVEQHLNERALRAWAAAEAHAIGHGGVTAVWRATGISRPTITKGLRELDDPEPLDLSRVRAPGGGRKRGEVADPRLLPALLELVESGSRGDPQSPLRWTVKSLRRLAQELVEQGFKTNHVMVGRLLREQGFSLQANAKTREGTSHPDRDAQFRYIDELCARFLAERQPAISVDTKKKELVGDFKNAGREYRPKGNPQEVRTHDFKIEELGKVNPYGILDLAQNEGWVNVGIDHDTAEFAVESIRRWWRTLGNPKYPGATELLITADCGGSNGNRLRLWKTELQTFANETGLSINVCHFPPGTSKWNKIEHRLFSFITNNWRGQPLLTRQVVINLIAATTTNTGLKVHAQLDENTYPKGTKITDQQLAQVNLTPHDFHGNWNYTIAPNK